MNVLSVKERAQILSLLVEGMSMRSVCRVTGVAKKTPERLLRAVGKACRDYHDEYVRKLTVQRVQCDEMWSFVGCKGRHANTRGTVSESGQHRGSAWVWIGLDADNKLAIAWHVGDRTLPHACIFMQDLRSRITNRIQLTTDGHRPYLQATQLAFGWDVDFSLLQKIYGNDHNGSGPEKRYSPGVCIGAKVIPICGNADPKHVSTSYAERNNLNVRMGNRRFTRLTNAFSKSLEQHENSLALHFMHYNYCRVHQTLRTTPAMAAGLSDRIWSLEDLVALI